LQRSQREGAAPRGALTAALERVRLVIDLGRGLGRTGHLTAEEVAVELLLASSPEIADSLEARVFEPLRRNAGRRAALEQTLDAFFEASADRRSAAAALHIHPNTLDYRLRRIEEMTGLRLSVPRDLAILVLAHSQRELRQAGAGAERWALPPPAQTLLTPAAPAAERSSGCRPGA
jgi:DNA-binding PucR family transcriptional regulator